MLGNLRHGYGCFTLKNGCTYEGRWKYDVLHGQGKVVKPDGQSYDGDWEDGKAHGRGTAQYENGSVYVGEYHKDQRNGWGTQYFPSGDKYEGEWSKDVFHGSGRWTNADGSHYEGKWDQGAKLSGTEVSKDSFEVYSGDFKEGLRHGKGVLFCRGAFKYDGDWQNGVRHGQGCVTYVDGSQYEGQWEEDKRNGWGSLKYASGYRYDGAWKNDRQHGRGVCHNNTGDKYIGDFVQGEREGIGRCTYVDGGKYEGQWKADKRHGTGTMKYYNGDVYVGDWSDDTRQGRGTCKFADGTRFQGDWEDDGWIQSAADPSKCRVAGQVTRIIAGKTAKLLIQARDEDDHRRLTGGEEFTVSVTSGLDNFVGKVADNGDGTYEATYVVEKAGLYELSITLDGEDVGDSPYPLRVIPDIPIPKHSIVNKATSTSVAYPDREQTFEILACDRFGNQYAGDDLASLMPLNINLKSSNKICHVDIKPQRDGRYLCSYVPQGVGFYRLHIECAKTGKALPRTPCSVIVEDKQQGHRQDDDDNTLATERIDGDTEQVGGTKHKDGTGQRVAHQTNIVKDEITVWEKIAAAAYAADGFLEGWDSEDEDKRKKASPEDDYIKLHPNVPVVENLEDIWMVSKLQQERKAKEERQKKENLKRMQKELGDKFGSPLQINEDEAKASMKQIFEEEMIQSLADCDFVQGQQPTESATLIDTKGACRPEQTNSIICDVKSLAAELDHLVL